MSLPLLLLTNDDGIHAPGLQSLVQMLQPLARLVIVAPDGPRSGRGCSITSEQPLTYSLVSETPEVTWYSCSGSPVDCIKLALDYILPSPPDLIVSGINHGSNASVNAHYSGTVGAAYEGAMKGVASIAFSLCDHRQGADFSPLTAYIPRLVTRVMHEGLPAGTLLNVNFPRTPTFAGIRSCRMAQSRWTDEYTERQHPWGGKYFWLVGTCVDSEPAATDTDLWALAHDYIAVTPITTDVTAYALLQRMQSDWG